MSSNNNNEKYEPWKTDDNKAANGNDKNFLNTPLDPEQFQKMNEIRKVM